MFNKPLHRLLHLVHQLSLILLQSLSAENIALKLKLNKKDWIIIDVKDKKADCWRCFGLPARKVNETKNEIYDKFVSCKYCYATYSYSSSTRNMNKHIDICVGFNPNQTHFTTSTEINSIQLTKPSISSPSNHKNVEPYKEKMKNLLSEWVCSNIRPLSIVEDAGLIKIIEEAIRIGMIVLKAISNLNAN
jgi:hypothetical protein